MLIWRFSNIKDDAVTKLILKYSHFPSLNSTVQAHAEMLTHLTTRSVFTTCSLNLWTKLIKTHMVWQQAKMSSALLLNRAKISLNGLAGLSRSPRVVYTFRKWRSVTHIVLCSIIKGKATIKHTEKETSHLWLSLHQIMKCVPWIWSDNVKIKAHLLSILVSKRSLSMQCEG